MKTKTFFLLGVALSFSVMTSCSSDDETDNTSGGDLPQVNFTAGYISDTRTSLQRDGKVLWAPNDMINVNGKQSTKTVISEAGKMASFVAEATPTYYAFYPASMVTAFDADSHTFSINFPATQPYKNTVSFSDNVNPAVAKSENTYLNFHNVCGMLKVPVNANVAATKARFMSMDKPVSGTATVDPAAGTLTMTGSGMTIDITSLKSLKQDTLTWVLPVGEYCLGWRIQLLDNNDNVLAEKVSPNALNITKGVVHVIAPEVKFKTGIFVANLYWAKGNLCHNSVAGTYTFATSQESYDATSAGGYFFCRNTLNSQITTAADDGDPCSKIIPVGSWRTPTTDEYNKLLTAGSVMATRNSKDGVYFGTTVIPSDEMKNNYLFLPFSGLRGSQNTGISGSGASGSYWTRDATLNYLNINTTLPVVTLAANKHYGMNIRCVSEQ